MYTKRIKETHLPWGATVLVAPFPSHSAVSFVGSVLGGTRTAGSTELARVHAAMLLEGTRKRSKKEIQLFLDTIGASLSFYTTSERLVFSGRVRKKHLDALLAFVAEAITEPTFPAKELEVMKKRDLATLSLSAQDTHLRAEIALARMLFVPGHPNYAETIDELREKLLTITRDELVALHGRLIGRNGLIFSAAGDIEQDLAARLTTKHFKKLPERPLSLPAFAPSAPGKAKKQAVPIEHKASIDYLVGLATGITSDHKDYPALLLGIQVLGNPGFTGRLMSTVREKEGLTYVAYSYMSGFTKTTDGYITIWSSYAPQLFAKGRAAVAREIKKLVEHGVTAQEAKKNREMFEARSRTQLSNSGALARAAHETIAQGYSIKRLDEFPQHVLRVTAAQIHAALKKYLIPSLLSESAAGPVEKL